jgi:hypothetical protein
MMFQQILRAVVAGVRREAQVVSSEHLDVSGDAIH